MKEKEQTAQAKGVLNKDADVALSVREKLAYGSGNFSYSIVWLPIMSFLNFFWTDVAMVPAAAAGVFLMVSKIWDAINDPIIGSIEDHSNGKFGRYRTWLWTWIGIVVFFVLTFTKLPGVSQGVQTAFSFAMYFILVVFYTTYEMAHVSLASVMTTNYEARGKLASYRMVFSNVSGIIVSGLFMVIVARFTNVGTGYIVSCLVWVLVSIPFFLWCFYGTKERVKLDDVPKVPLGEAIKAFFHCKPAIILACAHMCWGIAGGVLSAVRQYYFTYNLGDGSMFGTAMTIWMVGMAIGAFAANWFLGMFKSKRTAGMVAWGIIGIVLIVMFVVPVYEYSHTLFHILWCCEGAFGMVGFTAIYAMVPDVVEYEQSKNGARSSAAIFSFINFAFKFAQAVVVGVFNIVMGAMGYVAGSAQNDSVLNLFNVGMHLLPGIAFILGAVIYYFYKIDRDSHEADLSRLQG